MAYDEDLADRIRELIGGEADLTEKRMFGGLAFLLGGHMAVAVSGRGGLMVRVDPADRDELLARPDTEPMIMRGNPARGWLRVGADHVRTKRQLTRWVTTGTTYARTLPPKRATPRR